MSRMKQEDDKVVFHYSGGAIGHTNPQSECEACKAFMAAMTKPLPLPLEPPDYLKPLLKPKLGLGSWVPSHVQKIKDKQLNGQPNAFWSCKPLPEPKLTFEQLKKVYQVTSMEKVYLEQPFYKQQVTSMDSETECKACKNLGLDPLKSAEYHKAYPSLASGAPQTDEVVKPAGTAPVWASGTSTSLAEPADPPIALVLQHLVKFHYKGCVETCPVGQYFGTGPAFAKWVIEQLMMVAGKNYELTGRHLKQLKDMLGADPRYQEAIVLAKAKRKAKAKGEEVSEGE